MALKIKCRKCGTVMKVRDELVGKRVRCKKCQAPVSVRARPTAEVNDEELPFALFSQLESEGQSIGGGGYVACRNCGEPVGSDSRECSSCGTLLNSKKERKSRSKDKNDGGESQNGSNVVVSRIVKGLTVCATVGVVIAIGFLIKKTAGGGDGTTRVQIEYLGKTTTVWFRHHRKGERPEKLWRDQRWMPMGQVVGLDWAAVPLLLDALTDNKTHRLAERVLGKYQTTTGSPYVEDLRAGLKHSDQEVRTWTARLVTKLDRPAPDIISLLEGAAEQEDDKAGVATMAVEHLRSMETAETKK
jgi:hypothetical protein